MRIERLKPSIDYRNHLRLLWLHLSYIIDNGSVEEQESARNIMGHICNQDYIPISIAKDRVLKNQTTSEDDTYYANMFDVAEHKHKQLLDARHSELSQQTVCTQEERDELQEIHDIIKIKGVVFDNKLSNQYEEVIGEYDSPPTIIGSEFCSMTLREWNVRVSNQYIDQNDPHEYGYDCLGRIYLREESTQEIITAPLPFMPKYFPSPTAKENYITLAESKVILDIIGAYKKLKNTPSSDDERTNDYKTVSLSPLKDHQRDTSPENDADSQISDITSDSLSRSDDHNNDKSGLNSFISKAIALDCLNEALFAIYHHDNLENLHKCSLSGFITFLFTKKKNDFTLFLDGENTEKVESAKSLLIYQAQMVGSRRSQSTLTQVDSAPAQDAKSLHEFTEATLLTQDLVKELPQALQALFPTNTPSLDKDHDPHNLQAPARRDTPLEREEKTLRRFFPSTPITEALGSTEESGDKSDNSTPLRRYHSRLGITPQEEVVNKKLAFGDEQSPPFFLAPPVTLAVKSSRQYLTILPTESSIANCSLATRDDRKTNPSFKASTRGTALSYDETITKAITKILRYYDTSSKTNKVARRTPPRDRRSHRAVDNSQKVAPSHLRRHTQSLMDENIKKEVIIEFLNTHKNDDDQTRDEAISQFTKHYGRVSATTTLLATPLKNALRCAKEIEGIQSPPQTPFAIGSPRANKTTSPPSAQEHGTKITTLPLSCETLRNKNRKKHTKMVEHGLRNIISILQKNKVHTDSIKFFLIGFETTISRQLNTLDNLIKEKNLSTEDKVNLWNNLEMTLFFSEILQITFHPESIRVSYSKDLLSEYSSRLKTTPDHNMKHSGLDQIRAQRKKRMRFLQNHPDFTITQKIEDGSFFPAAKRLIDFLFSSTKSSTHNFKTFCEDVVVEFLSSPEMIVLAESVPNDSGQDIMYFPSVKVSYKRAANTMTSQIKGNDPNDCIYTSQTSQIKISSYADRINDAIPYTFFTQAPYNIARLISTLDTYAEQYSHEIDASIASELPINQRLLQIDLHENITIENISKIIASFARIQEEYFTALQDKMLSELDRINIDEKNTEINKYTHLYRDGFGLEQEDYFFRLSKEEEKEANSHTNSHSSQPISDQLQGVKIIEQIVRHATLLEQAKKQATAILEAELKDHTESQSRSQKQTATTPSSGRPALPYAQKYSPSNSPFSTPTQL